MTTAIELLKAPRIGVRDFKAHLSEKIKSKKLMVLNDRGESKKVVIDYNEFVELLELIGDLQDKELVQLIQEGHSAIEKGERGIDVSESFKRIRKARGKG
jgi:hypothetical protein